MCDFFKQVLTWFIMKAPNSLNGIAVPVVASITVPLCDIADIHVYSTYMRTLGLWIQAIYWRKLFTGYHSSIQHTCVIIIIYDLTTSRVRWLFDQLHIAHNENVEIICSWYFFNINTLKSKENGYDVADDVFTLIFIFQIWWWWAWSCISPATMCW